MFFLAVKFYNFGHKNPGIGFALTQNAGCGSTTLGTCIENKSNSYVNNPKAHGRKIAKNKKSKTPKFRKKR